MITYLDLIAKHYPGISCRSLSHNDDYDAIEHISGPPLPSKQELDDLRLPEIRACKWREIQEFRDWRIQNGGYKVGTKWFHSDNISRIQQLGLLLMGANMPPNIMWKTMDGTFIEMTPTLAAQIFQAAGASDMAQHGVAEYHRQQLLQSAQPQTYDFSGGWPPVFGE